MKLSSNVLKQEILDVTDERNAPIPVFGKGGIRAISAGLDAQGAVGTGTSEALDMGAEEAVPEVQAITPEQVLEEARQQAEDIVGRAEDEARSIRDEAEKAGYADGFRTGQEIALEETRSACTEQVERAAQLVRVAADDRLKWLGQLGGPLTAIVMSAVRDLLQRELATQHADIEHMVDDLLRYMMDSTKVEVRVHPDDFEVAAAGHPKWQHAKLGEWDVSVVPDANIHPGGCELQSEVGRVDATVETKLELLETTLRSLMERSVSEFVAAER